MIQDDSFTTLPILTESESYVTTDGQSASLSWNKAPNWGIRPDLYYLCDSCGFVVLGRPLNPYWRYCIPFICIAEHKTQVSFKKKRCKCSPFFPIHASISLTSFRVTHIIRAWFRVDKSVELSLRNYFTLCGTYFQNIPHSPVWVARDRAQSLGNNDWDT
jgi:hypothetical protein